MEDAGAALDCGGDGGGVEEVGGEEGEAGWGFGVEGEEVGRVGAREKGGVDGGVAWVLVLQEGFNQPRTDEPVGSRHAHHLLLLPLLVTSISHD